MKKILTVLKNTGTFLLKNPSFLMACIIAILVFFVLQTCNDNKALKAQDALDKQMAQQNYLAITGKISVEVNKLKDSVYSKNTLMLNSINDLKQYNASLFNELNATKGTILSAIDAIEVGGIDSVTVANTIVKYAAGNYGLKFQNHYADSGFVNDIEGESRFNLTGTIISPGQTTISKNNIRLNVIYGMRENGKEYQVFAISKSPLIKLTDLTGAYIIPKQVTVPVKINKWGVGPQIGFGFQPLTGKTSITFGVGVQYNLIRW